MMRQLQDLQRQFEQREADTKRAFLVDVQAVRPPAAVAFAVRFHC